MLNCVELSITAFGRSRRGTSDGMNACHTGALSAAVTPPRPASTKSSQNDRTPAAHVSHSAIACAIWTDCVTSSTLRRG